MMKKLVIKGMSLSCAMASFIACNAPKEQPAPPVVDREQIKKEIQAKENDYAAVYNSKELKNIGYYADDAVSFSQNRQPLIGKDAIVEYMKAGIDSSSAGSTISFTTNDVFVSNDGNQVVELGYYKLVDSTGYPLNTGNYMVLFEKRNGSYVSVREMSVSDMPLEF